MGYRTLRSAIDDLAASGQLVRIAEPVDAHLEASAIHRRVYQAGGPALLFERVMGCDFPLASNLFGTLERARYLFRDTLAAVRRLVELKVDPRQALAAPWKHLSAVGPLWHMLPRRVSGGPAIAQQTSIDRLPQIQSWPDDGGAFITLPQVYSEDPQAPGLRARTWACIACNCPAAGTSPIGRLVCTIRSTAASACTMPPRFARASRCG